MAKLVIPYSHPEDPTAFEDYHPTTTSLRHRSSAERHGAENPRVAGAPDADALLPSLLAGLRNNV